MKKQEYLNHVREMLKECDESFVKDILCDFEEHFEQGADAGKTEEEVAESLGDISEWIEEVKKEYAKKQLFEIVEETEINEIRKVLVKADSVDVEVSGESDEISWNLMDNWAKMNVHNYQVIETVSRGRLMLEVLPKEKSHFGIMASHVHFVLNLVDELEEVRIETGSGDIDVEDVEAEVFKLHARSGDVTVEDIEGDLWIKTQSGDIDVKCSELGQLILNSTSGDIDVSVDEAEEINIKSTSGEIEVETEESESMTLSSTSGDIEVEGAVKHLKVSSSSGDVEISCTNPEAVMIHTASGDVEAKLKGCNGMQGITETGSGDVDIDFEGVSYHTGSGFSWGDGSTQVVIKTGSGDISLSE